ncbi:hypothetical protein [Psychroflexus sp. MES1-P1E]|uniref:hypothetical protein n=1 Tax=Psychroflexus sp. MES1-P1E TaxID=2058320 RepID=UPI000C7E4ACA|nr:hypothetical protein [Psychroflexus sp. MES1-P1E]PKG43433.1 hypothetical protein CXF67_05045 [Psychroflexus sp. MES1-P1E]
MSLNSLSLEDLALPTIVSHKLLLQANLKLEKDLQAFIDLYKHLPNAHHYWATTYRHLRSDDLEGLALYYYVIGIIKFSLENQPNIKIKLHCNFENYFAKYIRSNFPQVKVSVNSNLKDKINYNFGPFKYILKAYKYALKNVGDKSVLKNKVWLSMPIQPEKHRYKHLLNRIREEKVFYTGRLEDKINENNEAKSIRFEKELGCKNLLNAFKKAFQLKQNLKQIHPNTLLNLEIRQNKIQHFWVMLLKEKAVEKAIKKYKPKSILYTTANTYPFARIISRQAFLNNVPFIVVACRPMFINTRLEERLIEADVKATNDAFVANNFAVWDKFSKNTLVKAGVDKEKIFVVNQNKQLENSIAKVSLKNALLILFSHEEELNQRLVDELLKLDTKTSLIIRQHPLKKLTEKQNKQLTAKFKITQDITSQPYSKYEFTNVLAITINSTAVLEAAQHGCGVIWLPHLNSRSIIFYEIMQKIGKCFESASELDDFLNSSSDVLLNFIESCQIDYKELFESEDETDQLIEALGL